VIRWGEYSDDRCEQIRRSIDEQFDKGASDRVDAAVVDHLSECAACSQYRRRLNALEEDVRSLPSIPFPDEALQDVLAKTAETPSASTRRSLWRRWHRPLAAAAALALSVTIPWTAWRSHLSAQQKRVDEAVVQTRYVLGVTAGAFRRAETVAVEDLYGERLPRVLGRFKVDWATKPFSYIRLGDSE
jgi:predicted anti-sigma-YlaC factor YlaD